MRHFIRRRLPIISFHNPNLKVKVITNLEKGNQSSIVVETIGGDKVEFVTSTVGTWDSHILQRLEDINNGTTTTLPTKENVSAQ